MEYGIIVIAKIQFKILKPYLTKLFYSPQIEDIDECQQGTANCGPDEICKNKPGGYTCACPAGHALNAQRRCEDVNECDFYKGQVNYIISTRYDIYSKI